MLDAELVKKMSKPPVVEYEIPKRIFSKHSAETGQKNSLLVEAWNFG